MMYLAEVVSGDEWSVPVCLACALAYPLQGTSPFRIQLHPELTHLENVAQSFEQLLRQPKPQDSCAGSAILLCLHAFHACVPGLQLGIQWNVLAGLDLSITPCVTELLDDMC